MAHRIVCAAGIASAALLMSTGTEAATDVVPSFVLSSNVADNVRLLPDSTVSDTSRSSVLNASLRASIFSERGYITLEPRAVVNAYSDAANSDLNGDDYYLRTRAQYEWQRVRVGLRSDYRREAVIRSELPDIEVPDFSDDIEIDNPDSVDSGRLIFIEQFRERMNFRPYVDFGSSERTRFRVQTNFTSVSYSGSDTALRTGYDSRSLDASLVRRTNERNRFTATVTTGKFEAAGTGNDTDSVGITGAFNSQLSELWELNLQVGLKSNDYRYQDIANNVTIDESSDEYQYQARARRDGERTRMDFTLGHRQTGSASGYVVNQDELEFYMDHSLTQRLSMRLGLRADRYEQLGNGDNSSNRDYLRAEFGMNWAIRPKWSLIGGYNYTSQDFVNEFSDARSSNVVYIGIGYSGFSRPEAP